MVERARLSPGFPEHIHPPPPRWFWERGKVAEAKCRNGSVRNPRWRMVCAFPNGQKQWQLFDVKADPDEQMDVATQNPEVVKELDAAYDK